MAKTDKIKLVDRQTGDVSRAPRFDKRDWDHLADYVAQEYERRKQKREDRERQWAEIDRQIAMEPDTLFKRMPDGSVDNKKRWMAEMELPLQAQALEVLTSDARRMLFPDSGPWFRAHAQVTDEYLRKAEGTVKVLGVEHFIPSKVNQDNADKLVESFLTHIFHQDDHVGRFDVINSEAFKYGIGLGRGRTERKNIYIHEARGTIKENRKIPVLIPCSIKNVYLEETRPTLHSSTVLGEAHIAVDNIKYENIALAANKGSNNPEDEDGGWMPKNLSRVLPDKQGYVRILEMEGDVVVPRKTVRSVVLPGAIITVAMGGAQKDGRSTKAVIRFRFRKYPFSSYLLFPYLHESADDAYASGPLMKGRPVQLAASQALNKFFDSAAIKNAPPLGYDPNSLEFVRGGGPNISPYAQWPTLDQIKVYTEIGGDPAALFNGFMGLVKMYADLTGVLPARLGAQTVSHTTAFAKNQEVQRGAARTIDYVNSIGQGPITRWLYMAYQMGLDTLSANQDISFWIDAYGGFVELDKSALPEAATFEWFGAGGPQERQAKQQAKLAALDLAMKMDQLNMAMGGQPTLDIAAAEREVLREGGWTDLEAITRAQSGGAGAAPGNPGAPGVPGAAQGNPGAAVAALQNLSSAGG